VRKLLLELGWAEKKRFSILVNKNNLMKLATLGAIIIFFVLYSGFVFAFKDPWGSWKKAITRATIIMAYGIATFAGFILISFGLQTI
jgi:hypothetical protein